MTFGAKPMGPPPLRPRSQSRGDTAFAVGSRALITPTGTAVADVQLLDEDGMPTPQRLPADASIVITAWRPRRSAPPRYRVCTPDQIEGWIDAANLRRLPPPPPPPPSVFPAAPPKAAPTKAKAKTTAKSAPKATAKVTPAPTAKPAAPSAARAQSAKPAAPSAARAQSAKPAAPSAARAHTGRTPSPGGARPQKGPSKPPAKAKRSRPAPKRAR